MKDCKHKWKEKQGFLPDSKGGKIPVVWKVCIKCKMYVRKGTPNGR